MLIKICRKSKSSLSCSFENTVTEGTWGWSKQCVAMNDFFH